MANTLNTPTLTIAAQTLLRLAAGFVFIAHGWQKFSVFTLGGTEAAFGQMGVPAAGLVAPVVASLEMIGGIALVLGLLTRVFAALLSVNMLGALFLVHAPAGIFVEDGGVELVLILAATAAAIALMGPGKIAVDRLFFGRSKVVLAGVNA